MKNIALCRRTIFFLLPIVFCVLGSQSARGMHRHCPCYPRASYDTHADDYARRDTGAPAGADTRGAQGARDGAVAQHPVAAADAVSNRRTEAAYVDALDAGYTTQVYNGLNYYYSNGVYYYEYANDGPTIYVPATMVNGVPTVPPRPYVYNLPAGYTIQSFGGVNFYKYYSYYYYVYYINGRAVYVLAPVSNGVPAVPQPPY